MDIISLNIYSFLMKEDIEFIRFCHKTYKNKEKWIDIIKKWNSEVIIPYVNYYYDTKENTYAIYISKEINTYNFFRNPTDTMFKKIDNESEQTKLAEIFKCPVEKISPLALISDKEKSCCVYTDNKTFLGNDMLCFSPCSDTSSVILSTSSFFNDFLPKSKHNIKLI